LKQFVEEGRRFPVAGEVPSVHKNSLLAGARNFYRERVDFEVFDRSRIVGQLAIMKLDYLCPVS